MLNIIAKLENKLIFFFINPQTNQFSFSNIGMKKYHTDFVEKIAIFPCLIQRTWYKKIKNKYVNAKTFWHNGNYGKEHKRTISYSLKMNILLVLSLNKNKHFIYFLVNFSSFLRVLLRFNKILLSYLVNILKCFFYFKNV